MEHIFTFVKSFRTKRENYVFDEYEDAVEAWENSEQGYVFILTRDCEISPDLVIFDVDMKGGVATPKRSEFLQALKKQEKHVLFAEWRTVDGDAHAERATGKEQKRAGVHIFCKKEHEKTIAKLITKYGFTSDENIKNRNGKYKNNIALYLDHNENLGCIQALYPYFTCIKTEKELVKTKAIANSDIEGALLRIENVAGVFSVFKEGSFPPEDIRYALTVFYDDTVDALFAKHGDNRLEYNDYKAVIAFLIGLHLLAVKDDPYITRTPFSVLKEFLKRTGNHTASDLAFDYRESWGGKSLTLLEVAEAIRTPEEATSLHGRARAAVFGFAKQLILALSENKTRTEYLINETLAVGALPRLALHNGAKQLSKLTTIANIVAQFCGENEEMLYFREHGSNVLYAKQDDGTYSFLAEKDMERKLTDVFKKLGFVDVAHQPAALDKFKTLLRQKIKVVDFKFTGYIKYNNGYVDMKNRCFVTEQDPSRYGYHKYMIHEDYVAHEAIPEKFRPYYEAYTSLPNYDKLTEIFAQIMANGNQLQRGFYMWGESRSGKTALVNAFKKLLGQDKSVAIQLNESRFELSRTIGKAVVSIDEFKGNVWDKGAETLKQITGQDALRCEIKGESTVYDVPCNAAIFIVSNNKMQAFSGDLQPLRKRFMTIQFKKNYDRRSEVWNEEYAEAIGFIFTRVLSDLLDTPYEKARDMWTYENADLTPEDQTTVLDLLTVDGDSLDKKDGRNGGWVMATRREIASAVAQGARALNGGTLMKTDNVLPTVDMWVDKLKEISEDYIGLKHKREAIKVNKVCLNTLLSCDAEKIQTFLNSVEYGDS